MVLLLTAGVIAGLLEMSANRRERDRMAQRERELIFVDTSYETAAEHWKSEIEPRRIDELPDPLRKYALDIARHGSPPIGSVFKEGFLMSYARLRTLDWLIIVARKSETGEDRVLVKSLERAGGSE